MDYLRINQNSKKNSHVIGHHQPDFSTNRTVCASCFKLEGIIGQLKGQLRPHGCVSAQNTSCERVVVSHFDKLTVPFFYENV